ncbi:MAG: MotA/TolQ/ExbB proton channel family protein [Alkalinema sp. CAN_BIN05]|nr:MotA/TolQ/ExbB proton channel family protein [Alkalinema sp. CAN_BIN05]
MGLFSLLFTTAGIVLFPLLGFSIFVIASAIERAKFWLKLTTRQPKFAKELVALYQQQPELAMEKAQRNLDLPLSRIMLAALQLRNPSTDTFRLAMEAELRSEIPGLRRFLHWYEMIVGLSPLLGLLGTVTGLIQAFSGLNIGDVGGTKTGAVSGGIAEALITTAAGIVVATIALVTVTIFRNAYQSQMTLIEECGGQMELIHRCRLENSFVDGSSVDDNFESIGAEV